MDAHVYLRTTSSGKEQDKSIEFQKSQLEAYADRLNLRITAAFAEFESAHRSRRIQLGKLMSKVKKGEIKNILCVSSDRLSRSSQELDMLLLFFKRNSVKVYTLK